MNKTEKHIKTIILVIFIIIASCILFIGFSKKINRPSQAELQETLPPYAMATVFSMRGFTDGQEAYLFASDLTKIKNGEMHVDEILFFLTEEDALKASAGSADGEIVLCVYPNERTEKRMEKLNSYVTDQGKEVFLSEYGLTYPLTVEQLVEAPVAFYDLLRNKQFIDATSYAYIFGT